MRERDRSEDALPFEFVPDGTVLETTAGVSMAKGNYVLLCYYPPAKPHAKGLYSNTDRFRWWHTATDP